MDPKFIADNASKLAHLKLISPGLITVIERLDPEKQQQILSSLGERQFKHFRDHGQFNFDFYLWSKIKDITGVDIDRCGRVAYADLVALIDATKEAFHFVSKNKLSAQFFDSDSGEQLLALRTKVYTQYPARP